MGTVAIYVVAYLMFQPNPGKVSDYMRTVRVQTQVLGLVILSCGLLELFLDLR